MRGGLLALLGVIAMGSVAHAQNDPRWDQGVQLRAQGRDAEALEIFQALHRDTASPRSLAQIALAEQALGRWRDAASHLDQALAQPDDWVERNRATLEQARTEIGRHPESAGAGPSSSGGGDSPLPIVGGVLLGVAGAAAIVAVIGAVLYEVHAGRWNSDECWDPGMTREQTCPDEDDSAMRAAYTGIGLGIGAVVLAGVGVALLAVGSGGGGESAEVRCGPGMELGVVCSGRF